MLIIVKDLSCSSITFHLKTFFLLMRFWWFSFYDVYDVLNHLYGVDNQLCEYYLSSCSLFGWSSPQPTNSFLYSFFWSLYLLLPYITSLYLEYIALFGLWSTCPNYLWWCSFIFSCIGAEIHSFLILMLLLCISISAFAS